MEPPPSIHVLIEKAQNEDPTAFDAFVERCQVRVVAVLKQHLGRDLEGKTELDDLVQETFLQTWRSLKAFQWKGEKAFWGWLESIAKNVVYMAVRHLKAKKRDGELHQVSLARKRCPSHGELVELLKASAVTPATILQRDERFERLRRSLSRLKPHYRKVLFLARVRGLPIQEVAQRMGRSPGATSVLLVRALMKLKQVFGETESLSLPDRSLEAEGIDDGE